MNMDALLLSRDPACCATRAASTAARQPAQRGGQQKGRTDSPGDKADAVTPSPPRQYPILPGRRAKTDAAPNMTEADARVLLRDCGGFGGLEAWIAGRGWKAAPGGCVV